MFQRLFMTVLFSAFFMVACLPAHKASAAPAAPTIAIVDVEKILAEAKAAKSLQAQLKAKKESFQKEFSAKEKELKAAETALLGQKEKVSAEEFNKQRKAYEEKVIETRKLFQKTRNSLEEGVAKAMSQMRKSIMESAAAVADEKGYDIVLTRESVLIAEKSLDITSDVLAKLDASLSDVKLQVQ